MTKRLSLEQLLTQTGGRYIIIVLVFAQVISLVGAIPGILSVQVNAQFDAQQIRLFCTLVPILFLLNTVILTAIGSRLTRIARKRLSARADGTTKPNPKEELSAWREITSITWRHGIAASLVIFIIVILPLYFITYSQSKTITSPFQPTPLNSPDPIYVLLGGLVGLLGSVILSILMIDLPVVSRSLMEPETTWRVK